MKRQGLWKNTDFMRFWLGQSVSQFGNQVTVIALPAIAIRVLHASVFTVGLLVGVWVDKLPRKPIMVACNIGRLASLASIPLAFYLNGLTMAQLFIIAGLSGVFTVFFDVSYQSYLPSLVESSDLLEGNSKLQTSASAAQVSGPTIAGALIGFLGAAVSVLVDIAGYVVSVLAMLSIRKSESIPQAGPGTQSLSFRSLLSEGVTLIIHTRILAILTLCITISNFGNTLGQSVYLYYALTTLHLSYFQVGLIGTSGGLGLLFGSLIANRVSRRLGIGRALSYSLFSGIVWVGYPLATIFPSLPTLILLSFLLSFPLLIFNITALSMMQRVTPDRLLGRMNATRRTISWGVIPVGAFLAGYIGEMFGVTTALTVGGVIAGGAALLAVLSPIHRLRQEDELDSFSALKGSEEALERGQPQRG